MSQERRFTPLPIAKLSTERLVERRSILDRAEPQAIARQQEFVSEQTTIESKPIAVRTGEETERLGSLRGAVGITQARINRYQERRTAIDTELRNRPDFVESVAESRAALTRLQRHVERGNLTSAEAAPSIARLEPVVALGNSVLQKDIVTFERPAAPSPSSGRTTTTSSYPRSCPEA